MVGFLQTAFKMNLTTSTRSVDCFMWQPPGPGRIYISFTRATSIEQASRIAAKYDLHRPSHVFSKRFHQQSCHTLRFLVVSEDQAVSRVRRDVVFPLPTPAS